MAKRKTPNFNVDTETMDKIAKEVLRGKYESKEDTDEEKAFRRSLKSTTMRYAKAFGYVALPAEVPDISDVTERPFKNVSAKRAEKLKKTNKHWLALTKSKTEN